jgi:hypothetical protein
MPVTAFDGSGLVSKLEILRGDLVDVLYQASKDSADYRFNSRISELERDDDAVAVPSPTGPSYGQTWSSVPTARIPRCGALCLGPRSSSSDRSAVTTRGFPPPTVSVWTADERHQSPTLAFTTLAGDWG